MVTKQVEINGKMYPCYETMGMYVRFRRMFDIEIHEADMTNSLYICGRVYCIIQSASKASDIEFDYDFESFCDALTEDQFTNIITTIFGKQKNEKEEKKAKSR